MPMLIADLAEPPSGHQSAYIYTVLSRATTLDGLAILRPFSPDVLRTKPQPALDSALAEFRSLDRACAAAVVDYDPVDDVDLACCWPPGYQPPGTAAPLRAALPGNDGTTLHEQHLDALAAQLGS